MKFKVVLPFILIATIWSVYNGLSKDENSSTILFFTIGSLAVLVGVPYSIAVLSVKRVSVDYPKKRLNVFVIIWGFLLFSQVFVHFGSMNE